MKLELQDTTVYQLNDSQQKLIDYLVSGAMDKDLALMVCTENATLDSAHEELIINLVKAIQYDPSEVALFHFPPKIEIPFTQLQQAIEPTYLIVFGMPPESLHLHLDVGLNEEVNFGGIRMLFAPSVEQLQSDKRSKGPLWKALKKMFAIKGT